LVCLLPDSASSLHKSRDGQQAQESDQPYHRDDSVLSSSNKVVPKTEVKTEVASPQLTSKSVPEEPRNTAAANIENSTAYPLTGVGTHSTQFVIPLSRFVDYDHAWRTVQETKKKYALRNI
jgi:hypothetical protein